MFDLEEIKKDCGIELVNNYIDCGSNIVIRRLNNFLRDYRKMCDYIKGIETNPLWDMIINVTSTTDILTSVTYYDYMAYRASLRVMINRLEIIADHMMNTSICPVNVVTYYSDKVYNFYYYA